MSKNKTHAPAKGEVKGRVRIIGGTLKGQYLKVLTIPGLRPTPDRLRENMFNSLGQNLHGLSALDAFSGTGALAFESYSRGCAQITAIEQSPMVFEQLKKQQNLCKHVIQWVQGDALDYFKKNTQSLAKFDVIFLDPPYALNLIPSILENYSVFFKPSVRIYAEHDRALPCFKHLHLHVLKYWKVGKVHAYIYYISS